MVSSESSMLGLQMFTFLLCPHRIFSLCMCILVSLPLLIRTPVLLDQGPILTTLITSLRALSPNIVTLGVRVSTNEIWRDVVHSITSCESRNIWYCEFAFWFRFYWILLVLFDIKDLSIQYTKLFFFTIFILCDVLKKQFCRYSNNFLFAYFLS